MTRPTPEMRRAMAEAEVGDDVYGEDPTVNRLQSVAAERLGFEAALWVPSGVMGNEIAVRLLTRPGDELLCEERSHVVQYELGGLAQLSGVTARTLFAAEGILTPELLRSALRPRVYYRSDTTAVVLENTHNLAGGTFYDAAQHRAVAEASREARLRIHVDGARIWNAAAALGVEPRELLAGVDTAMVTLSKGLCAPAGSLLLGSSALVAEARRVRKLLGGGMRQVGVLAAAGLVALESMTARLVEDHERARRLAVALGGRAGIEVLPVRTNIVVARLERGDAAELAAGLAERGVRVAAMDSATLRLVTHRDVDDDGCATAIAALEATLSVRGT